MVWVTDETRSDLLRLIQADFGRVPEERFDRSFVDWLHYQARRIPTAPARSHSLAASTRGYVSLPGYRSNPAGACERP